MNPALFFQILRARWRLFALVLVATLAAATAASLLLPKSWRATASLVVDRRESQSLSDALNVFVSPTERTAYLQTQIDIIRSPKVARKVVSALRLAERPSLQQDFRAASSGQGSIDDWLAENLARALEVETSQSSVIQVSFNAEDPADAANIANAFAQAYMDTTLELRVEPTRHAAAWFDEQLKTLRSDLATAQQRMTGYQREHGIVSADEKLDDEYTRLSDLSAQLSRAQEHNVELNSREALAQQALRAGGALDSNPDVRADPAIQALRTELLNGEAALRALAARYDENHPAYQRQLAENRYRREALQQQMRGVTQATTGQRREGEQRTAQISAALAAQRTRLLDLKESRDGLAVLARNVETAQSAYDTAMQRFVVNQVESRASQANAALLNPATRPQRPHRPDLMLNLALALVVGLMLGLGLVMAREMTDRRVHSVLELAETVRAPVLGELIAWTPPGRFLLPAPRGVGQDLPRGGAVSS